MNRHNATVMEDCRQAHRTDVAYGGHGYLAWYLERLVEIVQVRAVLLYTNGGRI